MSLPITRKEIVIAKYISTTLFIIAGLSTTFIVVILGNILLNRDIVIPGYAIFSAILATLIYCVVTIPTNYIGGYKAITVLNVIMIFPLMGMIGLMCNIFGDKTIMLKVLHSEMLISNEYSWYRSVSKYSHINVSLNENVSGDRVIEGAFSY